jgi:hypothetical protein
MNDSLLERAIADRRDAIDRAERAEAEVRALREAAQAAYDLIMLLAFAKPEAEVGVPRTFAVLDALRAALGPKP